MVLYQERSGRLYTGAKFHTAHKKRRNRFGSEPIESKIGDTRKKVVRARGGNIKIKAFKIKEINVTDQKAKTTKKGIVKSLFTNTASADYQRRSILTKGAIVQTDLGKVKITSRPGQSGQLSGVLME